MATVKNVQNYFLWLGAASNGSLSISINLFHLRDFRLSTLYIFNSFLIFFFLFMVMYPSHHAKVAAHTIKALLLLLMQQAGFYFTLVLSQHVIPSQDPFSDPMTIC